MSRTPRRPRRAAALVPALALSLALAACSGSDDPDGDPDGPGGTDGAAAQVPAWAERGTPPDDDDLRAGMEFAADAFAAMLEAPGVQVRSTVTGAIGELDYDLRLFADGGCAGTVRVGDGAIELLSADGSDLLRPDRAYLEGIGLDAADVDDLLERLDGRWVRDDAAVFGAAARLCSQAPELFLGPVTDLDQIDDWPEPQVRATLSWTVLEGADGDDGSVLAVRSTPRDPALEGEAGEIELWLDLDRPQVRRLIDPAAELEVAYEVLDDVDAPAAPAPDEVLASSDLAAGG